MVRSETPEPAGGDQSLGDLVALAAKDVSQLIRYEIDLAKTELKGDAKRVGLAGAPLCGRCRLEMIVDDVGRNDLQEPVNRFLVPRFE